MAVFPSDFELQMQLISDEDALLVAHFNGDLLNDVGDSEPDNSSGGLIFDSDVHVENYKLFDAVQLAGAVTNEISNPSFEVNVSDYWNWYAGYDSLGTGTQSDTYAKVGTYSAKITGDTQGWAVFYTDYISVADEETVTFSCWVYTPTGTDPADFVIKLYESTTPQWLTGSTVYASQNDQWEYLWTTWTNDTGGAVNFRVHFGQDNLGTGGGSTSDVWYIDACQWEATTYPTPYCDGSLGKGHTWAGTAHNSFSSRAATQLEYNIDAGTAFTIGFWWIPHTLDSEFPSGTDGRILTWYADSNDWVVFQMEESSDEMMAMVDLSGSLVTCTENTRTMSRFEKVHWIITWDGSTVTLYKDGVAQTDTESLSGSWGTAPGVLYIGSDSSYAKQPNGWMEELFVLDSALTQAEITQLYTDQCNGYDFDGVWTDIASDLRSTKINFKYGIRNPDIRVRVASTGSLSFALDNSASNSAGTESYYSPDDSACRSGFEIGKKIRAKFTYGGTTYYKWTGKIDSITPEPGRYGLRLTRVTAVDWFDTAAREKINAGSVTLTSKTADQVITTLLGLLDLDQQPESTNLQTGQDVFNYVLDQGRAGQTTITRELQKLCLSELGRAYVKGNSTGGGELVFEDRHYRIQRTSSQATLNDAMFKLKPERKLKQLANTVRTKAHPRTVAGSASTLWQLGYAPLVGAGQSTTFIGQFTDANDNRCGGIDVDGEGENEISNYDFESGITGWVEGAYPADGDETFEQRSEFAYLNDYSGLLTTGTNSGPLTYYVESPAITAVQNDVFYCQVWVYVPAAWPGTVDFWVTEYDSGDGFETNGLLESTSTTGSWVRLAGKYTCSDADTAKIKLAVGTMTAADFSGGACMVYVDDVFCIQDSNMHYLMNSEEGGGGDDLTSDFVVTPTEGGFACKWDIENTGTTPGYITLLKATGKSVTDLEQVTQESIDATSIKQHGTMELDWDMPYQEDPLVARDAAQFLRTSLKSPWTALKAVSYYANDSSTLMGYAMAREPGDRITLTETMTGISSDWFINGVEFDFEPSVGGEKIEVTWYITPARDSLFWAIGTVGYSEIGETTYVTY